MMEIKKLFQGTPGLILAIGAAFLLVVGGCVVCGGGLLVPYVMRSRQAAARRAEAEEHLRQLGKAMHEKAAQESVERQDAESDAGDLKEAAERE
jgi:hypothetical protein